MSGVAHGSYGLTVYKKGYERFFQRGEFSSGSNVLILEIKALSAPPASFTISGIVIEIISSPGSKSENHFFKIKQASGQEDYLFNQLGYNNSGDNWLKDYINKKVTITGYRGQGYIGWQHEPKEGIYVEKIK